jgi:hypothetical protein
MTAEAKLSLKDRLIGNPQNTSLETRIINVVALCICLIGVFKIVSNALLLNLEEAIIAAIFAVFAGGSYLYIRSTHKWERIALPVALLFLGVLTYDWVIDPDGVLSNDGYYFMAFGVIASIILKQRYRTPFAILICLIVVFILAKGLLYPQKIFPDAKARLHAVLDTGITMLLLIIASIIIVRIVLGEYRRTIEAMKKAQAEVKVLKGLLPICSKCKRIRKSTGDWEVVEAYIANNSEATFTHGVCPDCGTELLKDFYHFKGLEADKPEVRE